MATASIAPPAAIALTPLQKQCCKPSRKALFNGGAPCGAARMSCSLTVASMTEQSRRQILSKGAILVALPLSIQASSLDLADAVVEECSSFTYASSGLGFCDITIGSGLQASKSLLIKAHYVGKLENGSVFDSSYSRGKPLTFRLGVREVIKGWDEGILGGEGVPPMLAGGKRRLKIPPQLGYGERGAGCRGGLCIIPPNSVLLFDVEFVGKA